VTDRHLAAAALVLLAVPLGARAHPLHPALLELREREGALVEVTWRAPSTTQGQGPFQPILPGTCSAASEPTFAVSQAGQSVVRLRCPAGLVGSRLRVVGLRERRTEALVRVQLADGRSIQAVLRDDEASFTVPERAGRSRWAPWAMSFTIGLLHGLGFAGALARVGLPRGEIPVALFSFNAGIEAGQLAFVMLVCAAGYAMGRWSAGSRP
jgi:HupE / UreJ protein